MIKSQLITTQKLFINSPVRQVINYNDYYLMVTVDSVHIYKIKYIKEVKSKIGIDPSLLHLFKLE
eukprot:CAMPEP_0116928060 /NCGR_PEP_ID=MMETSP0467-20121206/25747_1 /TAXON_ID=283647 /ORGANISM="Mesodinium pulex, Strain SPMC105" /LENGTH=64 /DNA_ID=CAMNT_0004607739 /DNA_START=530 /DNA_END=724 /DNA_ORIENTATION=+